MKKFILIFALTGWTNAFAADAQPLETLMANDAKIKSVITAIEGSVGQNCHDAAVLSENGNRQTYTASCLDLVNPGPTNGVLTLVYNKVTKSMVSLNLDME